MSHFQVSAEQHDPCAGLFHGQCAECQEPWPCDFIRQQPTLRDRFAMAALTGLLALPESGQPVKIDGKTPCRTYGEVNESISQRAYLYADAMLAAREAKEPA